MYHSLSSTFVQRPSKSTYLYRKMSRIFLCLFAFCDVAGVVLEIEAFASLASIMPRRALDVGRHAPIPNNKIDGPFSSSLGRIPRGGSSELSVRNAAVESSSAWSVVEVGTHAVLSRMTRLATWTITEISNMTQSQKFLLGAVFVLGFLLGRLKPFWKRFTQVVDIPSSWFGSTGPVLTGRAVSVSDGDTIRFLHTPTPWHPRTIRKTRSEKLSEHALPIRICTIDTPETAKFGKSGQPFGEDAKRHLQHMLDGKRVKVRLLQSDQYGRGVAQVFVRRHPLLVGTKRFVDETMLLAGLAEVYQGGGAVYGPKGFGRYLEMQEEAQKNKVGMWSQGKKRESAAEYKRRTK